MTSKLKALGLTLLAAFALSAVAASAASATEATFSFGAETGHLEGTGGEQVFLIRNSAGEALELKCPNVEIETTTSTFETESVNEITAGLNYNHPETGSCEAPPFITDIDSEECHHRFKAETNDKAHATMQIQCPEGQQVHFKATLFGSQFECLNFPPQSVGGKAGKESGVHYESINTPEEKTHVNVEITIAEELKYTVLGVCGETHTTEDGSYQTVIPVTAENTEGVTVNASYTPATE